MDTIDFLRTVFGDAEGFLFLSGKQAAADAEITVHKAFQYPDSLSTIKKYTDMRDDEDLYFSPMLYKVPLRRQSSVKHTPVVYADTDTFPVEKFLVPPSINIETSPGRHASLWILDSPDYDPEAVAAASRAIALTHADRDEQGRQIGTDPGGWDLTQLLRMPNSSNLKYMVPNKYEGYDQAYPVFVDDELSPLNVYSLQEITDAYNPANIPALPARVNMDMPDLDTLPKPADVLRRITASPTLSKLYSAKPRMNEDRSQALYHFICECLRAGFSPEETFVVAWYAESNKYRIDGRPRDDLWTYDMRKAMADPENRPRATVDDVAADPETDYAHPKDAGLSTAVEFALLKDDELPVETFVDQYIKWASSKTDAPAAYHRASALTILALVFGEFAMGVPQWGELKLGLNFVVMGETTETRKSTARMLMKRCIRSIEDDQYTYLLTSDATEEALIEALSERENQSSLYDRDEAQKLIADVKGGKGYMKGFLETLNELYDGRARGRLRSGKTATKEVEVNFCQYFMGIRSQIQDNLELEDFQSGWGPRNIYVRGESPKRTRENGLLRQMDMQDVNKPDPALEALTATLKRLRSHWESRGSRSKPVHMPYEDDAWEYMAGIEWDLKEYFGNHPRYSTLVSCIERMQVNAIKVGILFAMCARRSKANMQDVINVRAYVAQWVEDLVIVVEGVNESLYARDLKALENYIAEAGGLVKYAAALKWAVGYGKDRREFTEMVETLVEQDVIRMVDDKGGKKSLELLT